MPGWWHEGLFDVLCLINSLAAAVALVGVGSLRRTIKKHLAAVTQEPISPIGG